MALRAVLILAVLVPGASATSRVLGVLSAAFACAGFESFTAAAQWAASADRDVLLSVQAVPYPLTGQVVPPSESTIRRVACQLDLRSSAAATSSASAWSATNGSSFTIRLVNSRRRQHRPTLQRPVTVQHPITRWSSMTNVPAVRAYRVAACLRPSALGLAPQLLVLGHRALPVGGVCAEGLPRVGS